MAKLKDKSKELIFIIDIWFDRRGTMDRWDWEEIKRNFRARL